jgi:two-component system NtrC family response regulator
VLTLKEAREAAERREIPHALSHCDGNVSKAARLLGVSRPTLYDLIKYHNIKLTG